jgi:uncharacterized protein YbjT (DUF2867 family)
MAPTILVVGATGNTGRGVLETLPNLLKTSANLSGHRVLALTRDASSASAKRLSTLSGVEITEKNWTDINAAWLRSQEVARVFFAGHIMPSQFAEESQLYVELLRAGVKYLVRIATTDANMHADSYAHHSRTHWALENLLSQPEFEALHYTSLHPNLYYSMFLYSPTEFIKEFRRTGKQTHMSMIVDASTPMAPISPVEVGATAAHLLALEDVLPHNGKKYVLNGPVDITGNDVVALVEEYIGEMVDLANVTFKDVSMIERMADALPAYSRNLVMSVADAPKALWEGRCGLSTGSEEIQKVYKTRVTVGEFLEEMVQV